MNIFDALMSALGKTPDFVPLIVIPALLAVTAILFAILGWRKRFPAVAFALGCAGSLLVLCKDAYSGFGYLLLFGTGAGLLAFALSVSGSKKSKPDENLQRELYEKFAVPLDLPAEESVPREETFDREECGLRLAHTKTLLEQLKKSELSASDRLEADALSRTMDAFGDRELTSDEMRSLNDCLATVLKLTAKYKL